MFANVRLRKWGNSLGAVIPRKVVEEAGLKENEEVVIRIEDVKAHTARELFGALKLKHSGQKVKDEARGAWSRW